MSVFHLPKIEKCPECHNGHLVPLENGITGQEFTGCTRWPKCEYTDPCDIDEGWRGDPNYIEYFK